MSAVAGKGVVASIGPDTILAGKRELLVERGVRLASDLERKAEQLLDEGKTLVWIGENQRQTGLFAIADTVKEHAAEAVAMLKDRRKKVYLITGDNERTARAVARQLGIEQVVANVLPQDKAEIVRRLAGESRTVAMVGDGINDAPALAAADVGIALGSGTDVAIETGDIILVRDDVRDVVAAMDLGAYTMKKIRQNLFWAFFYNLLGLPIAAGILYPFTGFLLNPMIAGAAMAFSSVSVVSNSLLIRRYKKPS
jgi:Cu+-exporting ATPase